MPSVISINIGKYNTFHGSDEAMLLVLVKACLQLKIFLIFGTLKDFVLLITTKNSSNRFVFLKTSSQTHVKLIIIIASTKLPEVSDQLTQ